MRSIVESVINHRIIVSYSQGRPVIIWTKDNIADMVALWNEGLSYGQMARRLSVSWGTTVTKNMIVGVAHRHFPSIVKQKKKLRNEKRRAKGRKVQLKQLLPGLNALFGIEYVRDRHKLHNVHGATCQYLHGEPRDRNFCGAQAVRDPSIPHAAPVWCAKHIRAVYMPKGVKKKKVAVTKGGRIVWETVG